MIDKKVFLFLIPLWGGITGLSQADEKPLDSTIKDPVDYVDPYIGSIGHILVPTFPTTHLPNSLVRVHPLRSDYTSELLQGLPLIIPKHRRSGLFRFCPATEQRQDLLSKPLYTYDLEKTTPYSYAVFLDEIGVQVDYSPSHQSGLYQLQFPEKDTPYLALNLDAGALEEANGAIFGYGLYEKIADYFMYENEARFYFYMEFDRKPESIQVNEKTVVVKFDQAATNIGIRYGISFISAEQAKKNLYCEISGFDLHKLMEDGRVQWNKALGKIHIEGTEEDKTTFYTALYRTYERMVNISEDGRYYSAFDSQVHDDEGIPFYTDDWVWDTYLAAHPLGVLITPTDQVHKISSFIRMYEQSGSMPTFPSPTGDDASMFGNHTVALIWDAYSKGLRGFDLEKAYEASRKSIMEETMLPWKKGPLSELDIFFQQNGYYPALHPGEAETVEAVNPWERRQAVAITLAASYNDWCLAQMARELDKTDDYEFFIKRSLNYRNLFNPATGFFHPKDKEGRFIEPFDYVFSGGQGVRDYYSENNGWTFRWGVLHNIADMVQLMGGPDSFVSELDKLFTIPLGKTKFEFYRVLPDHTGNVGQFSMGNEPSFHIPYLYNYAGQPWKTQKRIRNLLKQWFRNDLMGIPGDEDGGGMSGFVVFSMMGFYPVTPGTPFYAIGSPLFPYVKIDVGNGKYFEIEAANATEDNKYIQSATLNGKNLDKAWFSHSDIANGGKLTLVMGSKASKTWGTAVPPPSGDGLQGLP